MKKAELAQKVKFAFDNEIISINILSLLRWSKREEQDFVRVISFFGNEFENNSNRYDWTKFRYVYYFIVTIMFETCWFRALASLGKKSDERLKLYLYDFKEMCRRVIAKRRQKIGTCRIECIALTFSQRIYRYDCE